MLLDMTYYSVKVCILLKEFLDATATINNMISKYMKHWMIFKRYISEPCQLESYTTDTLSYDRNSMMAKAQLEILFKRTKINFETTDNRTSLFISYPNMEVKVSEQVQILDTSSFISSVGGNLGLFIGFSFLDTFFAVYKWFSTRSLK